MPRPIRNTSTADAELTQIAKKQLDSIRVSVNREPLAVSGSNVAEISLLEKCLSDQNCNQRQIDDIATRIAALINRLQGHALGSGGDEECGEMKSIGVLGEHQAALKYEGQCLGEIQCDLAVLERLL